MLSMKERVALALRAVGGGAMSDAEASIPEGGGSAHPELSAPGYEATPVSYGGGAQMGQSAMSILDALKKNKQIDHGGYTTVNDSALSYGRGIR